MLSNIGIPGLVLIIILALIVFGPSKLPEIGKAFGRSLKEFKDATKDLASDFSEHSNKADRENQVLDTNPHDQKESETR